jgi:hypothetical protein
MRVYKYYNNLCLSTETQHNALGDITLKHES